MLEDLIHEAEGLDLAQYTEESAAVFRTALASAQAVFADQTLSVEDQQTVDDAVASLKMAKAGLVASAGGNEDNNNTGNTGNSGNNNTGNTGNAGSSDIGNTGNSNTGNNNTGSNNTGNSNTGAKAAKTGDAASPILPMVGAAAAILLLAGTAMARKRR